MTVVAGGNAAGSLARLGREFEVEGDLTEGNSGIRRVGYSVHLLASSRDFRIKAAIYPAGHSVSAIQRRLCRVVLQYWHEKSGFYLLQSLHSIPLLSYLRERLRIAALIA